MDRYIAPAISAFTTSMWIMQEVEQRMEQLPSIWTLPTDDHDFSKRWGLIKAGFSNQVKTLFHHPEWLSKSKKKHREGTIWQRRFWEHQIRDQTDFNQHIDYIYWNPVKHGHVSHVIDWPYSTFHRDVKNGIYTSNWGGDSTINIEPRDFGE